MRFCKDYVILDDILCDDFDMSGVKIFLLCEVLDKF